MNDKQERMQAVDKALGWREAKPQSGRDKLHGALAAAVATATVCGFITWLGWSIHTVAGWLG